MYIMIRFKKICNFFSKKTIANNSRNVFLHSPMIIGDCGTYTLHTLVLIIS